MRVVGFTDTNGQTTHGRSAIALSDEQTHPNGVARALERSPRLPLLDDRSDVLRARPSPPATALALRLGTRQRHDGVRAFPAVVVSLREGGAREAPYGPRAPAQGRSPPGELGRLSVGASGRGEGLELGQVREQGARWRERRGCGRRGGCRFRWRASGHALAYHPMASVNRPNAPQDYRTPPALLDAIRAWAGELHWDAACETHNCVGTHGGYVHPTIDALERDWSELGDRTVWCNSPWSHAGRFAERCAARLVGRTLLLVQAAVDSTWFDEHVQGRALVLALRPRIPFLAPDGSPAFVDRHGKPLGVNRPAMLCAYGWAPGFRTWDWRIPLAPTPELSQASRV